MYEQLNLFDLERREEKVLNPVPIGEPLYVAPAVIMNETDEPLVPCIRCGNDPVIERDSDNSLGWIFQDAVCPVCGYRTFKDTWNMSQERHEKHFKKCGWWHGGKLTEEQKAKQKNPYESRKEQND